MKKMITDYPNGSEEDHPLSQLDSAGLIADGQMSRDQLRPVILAGMMI